jgi:hypothetical protein
MNCSQKKIAHSSKEITMAKIKVSQATIDNIKKLGMDKALKAAAAGKADAEMREGLKRMYGQKRLDAAESSTKPYNIRPIKPAAKSADAARSAAPKTTKPVAKPAAKSADSARSGATKKATPTKTASAPKKTSTTSNPFTGAFNALSPYGNKEQKFKSPTGKGLATRKAVPGKPSIGEKISNTLSGKSTGGSKKSTTTVASENAKRMGISVAEYNKRLKGGK